MGRWWGRASQAVLHVCALPPDGVDLAGLAWALDADARDRLASLRHEEDGIRLAVSRAVLRSALAGATGIEAADQRFVRRCVVCAGPHGAPRLVPPGADPDEHDQTSWRTPHTSISHADRAVAVALHPRLRVGVDVESVDGTSFTGFDDVALTPAERAQLHALPAAQRPRARATWWTRKEAVLKATGHGLAVDPAHLRLSPPDAAPAVLDWTAPEAPRPVVALADISLPAPHVAAVAVIGASRISVEVRQVDLATLLRA